jgi:hypothetical protein
VVNHNTKIISGTTVIEAKFAVHLFAAATVIPGEYIKVIREAHSGHALDIASLRVTLQAVRNNYQSVRALFDPVEIQKIMIWSNNTFARITLQGYPPDQGRIYSFEVSVEKKKWWLITRQGMVLFAGNNF